MKRRLMAAMLAGILVFSNTGAVFAAENAGGSGTAAESALSEEQTQGQDDAADEDGEETEPAEQESVQEDQQDAAQQEGEAETGREIADENEEGISEESADEEDEKDIEAGSADDAAENDLSEETADDELSEEAAEEAVEEEAAQGETIEEDNTSEEDDVEEAPADQDEAAAEEDADVSDDAKEGTADRNAGEDTVRAGAASEEVTVTEEEPEQEEGARAAKGDTDTWEIKIEAEKDDALYVFTDGELEVFVTDLTVPEGTEYSINWYVGHGAWNSENNEFDEWNFGEGSGWTKEDDGRIVLDGAAFIGTDCVEVRASLKCDGEETASAQRTFEVREPYVEDQWQFGDRDMLPGWEQRIDRSQRVYVENSQYPRGEHFEREVTSVDVEDVDGENVVFIENSDENGWNLRAQNMGESRVTVTYTDWDGTEGQTVTFLLSVGQDVYGVDLWTDSGSDIALPGKTVSMTAQAWHEQHDHDGETDLSGISYSWNFDGYYGNNDYIDLINLSPTSGKTTVVSFEDIPADAGDLGINVTVSIYENNEKKAVNNYWLHVRGQYFEIWPVQLDSSLDVGSSISPTFEVRSYDVDNVNDYSVLPAEDVQYEWHFDRNAFTITQTEGGQTVEIPDGGTCAGNTVSIKRKGDWDTDLAVKAFWQDEHGDDQEVWNHYYFDKKNYDFRFFEHDADLFAEDPAPPVLVLDTGSLGEGWQDRFDLDLAVGHWDRDAFADLLDKGEEGDYQVSYTDNAVQVALTPSYLAKVSGDENIGHDDVRIAADLYPKGADKTQENRICGTDAWFHIRKAWIEYEREYDRDMLPGWDGTIQGTYNVHMENMEYPDGYDTEYRVTNVEKVRDDPWEGEDGSVITDFHRDQDDNDENDYWWYYRVENHGEATLKVTYEDIDGQEQSYEFTLHVGGDVYSVHIESEGGARNSLPGGSIELYAVGCHEYYDENGDYQNSADGLDYDWSFEYGEEFADLTVHADDHSRATLTFKALPEGWDWIDEDFRVAVKVLDQEGHETSGYASEEYAVHSEYTEIWPLKLDSGLDVGSSISPTFEVRRYPADNDDGYSVLPAEDVQYEWHFDRNAFTITETAGGQTVEIPDGGTSAGSTVSITRKGDWNTDLSVRAFWTDEHGNEQDVWNQYHFDEKHYDLRFFEHDADLFAEDPAPPVLVLDTGSLGEGWQDRFDLDLAAGHWDRDAFADLLDDGDYQVSYTDNAVQVALTPSYLAKVAGDESIGHDDVRIAADLYPKGADKTQENRICDTDAWFHIRKAWIEYEREYDRDMLPGWDGTIQGTYNVHMENMEYPDGYDTEYRVINVEKVRDDPWEGEDGSVITDFHRDQDDNDENDYWWYYRVENHGEATLKVTYEDIDGQEQSYEFTLHVGEDVYSVHIESEGGARNSLPGGTIELYAVGCHEYYDENGDYQNKADGLDYDWSFEYGEEFADLTVHADDHSRATLTFKALPEGWDWIDEDVRVAVKVLDPEGHETSGYASEEYAVHSEYTEIWPLELDKALDVGSSITPTFEVRRYPADNDDGYSVLPAEDVQYEWHFDRNAFTITEMAGGQTVEIPDGGTSAGNTVSITRKGDWWTDLSVRAFWRDNHGNEQDVWNQYHFDDKNYNYEAELSVPANAVFYAVPGKEYTAEQIFDKISPTFKVIYEAKPEGETRPISGCWIREVKNGGDSVALLSLRDDGYAKMIVSGSAPEGEVTLIIGAKEAGGMTAEAECKVMIHNHNVTSRTASKATLTADGVIVNTCTVCGETVSTTPISHPAAFTLSQTAYTYTGAACNPAVTVKDAAGKVIAAANYTVAFKNNVNAGTASAVVTFKGNYSGSKTIAFKIAPAAAKDFILSKKTYVYTGKALKPAVTVKDAAGKVIPAANYTVTFSANKNPGKASVKIVMKGNYSGQKTLNFTINPKKTKLSKPTTDGNTVTVKWTKMTKQTTGYQIQYGLKSNFKGAKTKTISKNKTVSAKIKGLKPGKKYYFRIRTYKKVGSKKYVSAWSAKKSITVE